MCFRKLSDRGSQRTRLIQDALPKERAYPAGRDDIHAPPEQCFGVLLQSDEIEQRCVGCEFHQQIDVAPGMIVAVQRGAEDTNVGRMMTTGQCQECVAVAVQVI